MSYFSYFVPFSSSCCYQAVIFVDREIRCACQNGTGGFRASTPLLGNVIALMSFWMWGWVNSFLQLQQGRGCGSKIPWKDHKSSARHLVLLSHTSTVSSSSSPEVKKMKCFILTFSKFTLFWFFTSKTSFKFIHTFLPSPWRKQKQLT